MQECRNLLPRLPDVLNGESSRVSLWVEGRDFCNLSYNRIFCKQVVETTHDGKGGVGAHRRKTAKVKHRHNEKQSEITIDGYPDIQTLRYGRYRILLGFSTKLFHVPIHGE